MKKIIPLFFAAVVIALTAQSQTPRYLDPRVVSINKELPRTDVVSYDSRAEAVRRTYGASKYLQPLTEWSRTETSEAVTYTTRFKVPFEWIDREQFLYLGRVSGSFDVVVNGALAAYSQTGSTPSEFDITAVSREGANDLAVVIYKEPVARKLENGRPAAVPQVEGEAHILSQPRVRVRDVAVSTRTEGSGGLLELGVIMKSHRLNTHDYTVYYELLSPMGEILAEGNKTVSLDMRREDTVRFFANVPRVVPWSHEEPRLYTLHVKTRNEGRFREYLSFKVGFRSIDLADDGVLRLNGVPIPLTMREFSPTGDLATMRTAIEQLRAQGVGGLILRGSPPDRGFYALCDELGVYLSCRADIDTRLGGASRAVGGNPSNDPEWEGAYLDRTMSMYHTSKNHPSVAMFSLAEDSANGYNLYESYLALKAAERHRPVLYPEGGEWNTDRLAADPDRPVASLPADSPSAFRPAPSRDVPSAAGPDRPVAEWLTLTAESVERGRFRVGNSRRITPFTGEAVYSVSVGKKVVSRGSVPVEVLPGESTDFTVPIAGVKKGKLYAVTVELAAERSDGDYLPSGDPDRKVFRRLDTPLAGDARTTVVRGDFPSERPFSATSDSSVAL